MNNSFKNKLNLDFTSKDMSSQSSQKSVVIADDDLSSRVFLKIKFEKEGFSVKDFRSGAETWDYIEGKKINLLIMEMKLPELHGSELLKKVKKTMPKLPVIIYTYHPEFEQDMTVVTFPNHEYLIKPTPAEKIVEIAKHLMERAK